MPMYVIERDIPDLGKLSPDELKKMSQDSCNLLYRLGGHIQWNHSYVTDNKLYCVYIATNEDLVVQHARMGQFPANKISEVKTVISPVTAE